MSGRSEGTQGSPSARPGLCHCGIPVARLVSWTHMNPGRRYERCKFYTAMARRRDSKVGSGCNYWRWVDEGNNGWQTDLINALLTEKKELKNEIDVWKDKLSFAEAEMHELEDELTKLKKKKGKIGVQSEAQQYGMGFYVMLSVIISVVILKLLS